jgi:dienelactone hydrolase
MKTEDLEYKDGNVTCRGYLAYDESHAGKRPGILVVHEAFGLGKHVMDRAKMLADLGYVALAADLYGDRKRGETLKEIGPLMNPLRENRPALRVRARAALDALAGLSTVDTSRMAAIGYCFGGTTVLELARNGAPVKGVVSFHGNLTAPLPAEKGKVSASVLVCNGADDPSIPPDQVVAFEEEMRQAGADWQVINYGGTVHSFTNPAADSSLLPYTLYNESADKRSWIAMRAFFDEIFA